MSVNDSDVDDKELHDKHACAEVIQAWGLYRDQGKWPELLATFTPDGQIAVSWFSGSFREFVDRCTRSFNAGQRSKHHIFPSLVRVAGERAVAETNIVILVRQKIGDVLADMTSYARFLDRLERASGRWAIVERAAIYERDRLDPVEPSEGIQPVVHGDRPYGLSGALPLHGRASRRRRPCAGTGGLQRRLAPHRAAVRALRGLAGAARLGRRMPNLYAATGAVSGAVQAS